MNGIKCFIINIILVLLLMTFVCCSINHRNLTYIEASCTRNLFTVQEGLLSTKAQKIIYKKMEKSARIILSEPIVVAQSEREEPWGFFQYPNIAKAKDGTLIVTWQMKGDSYTEYGKVSKVPYNPMMSKDYGHTWIPKDHNYNAILRDCNNVYLKHGGMLQVDTPPSKSIKDYSSFPKPIGTAHGLTYFFVDDLPNELQGVYFNHRNSKNETTGFQAKLKDPGLLRYSINGMVPVLWWGNIRQLANESLLAGVYPCSYCDESGEILPMAISFYQSYDNGHNWEIIGKIPFSVTDTNEMYDDYGFVEPAFEILKDSSLLCVMRTGMVSPMYESFSYDMGKTWSPPFAISPNGVSPKLLLLANGILVLVSGRPGIQVRFSLDGRGNEWTDPIEMIPYDRKDGGYERDVSCGYASVIEADDNSFYLVYSDFTYKDRLGCVKKRIIFRKISVFTK